MDWLVWGGAVLSFAGLAGLVWCIMSVWRARGQNLPDEELRAVVAKMVPLNMGALFLSVIGLMMVILGVFLG
ncbi:hypothetical protein TRP8649_03673 [Pelagimonas phthalicica]|uniref:Uncharacterized protein n=1 Tax=Pelagimonas phthalicica TaxID=1037362 RepID=A0A238JI89_9RHOB|nr:hypothetical protein [Pelagimonas phthalicica]TDS92464.1 hypothetical protein CLV87_3668 [Pelagimonas phthalicica]SMX29536.1 hypothetical protein TRP8649_03673 [Pelagimonas phthalicica]